MSLAWQIPVWVLAAVMAVRILFEPYFIWREEKIKHQATEENLQRAEAEAEALQRRLAELEKPKPAPPDYEGIYQNNLRRGEAKGALKNIHDGIVSFQIIQGDRDLNLYAPFDWQDLLLQIDPDLSKGSTYTNIGGHSLRPAICKVLGPSQR